MRKEKYDLTVQFIVWGCGDADEFIVQDLSFPDDLTLLQGDEHEEGEEQE